MFEGKKILLAQIGAAHGIQGHVKVKTFTSDPFALKDYQPLMAEDGSQLMIKTLREKGTGDIIVLFEGISDRNAAEALRGTKLFTARDSLAALEDEDEFYQVDLLGLEVRDQHDKVLGKVLQVQDFGAGDLLEVRPQEGPSFYIPFTRAFVPHVNLSDGYLVTYWDESEESDESDNANESEKA